MQIEALSAEKTTPAESAALDEVRFAIEDIVVVRKQPVELMPQIPRILEMQVHRSLSILRVQRLRCRLIRLDQDDQRV